MSSVMMLEGLGGGDDGFSCGTCGMGALGDWGSEIDAFFAKAKKDGIAGTVLQTVMVQFISTANSAPDTVKYPFLYEINERAELKSDSRVPNWLLDQIKSRLQGIVTQTGNQKEAEGVLRFATKGIKYGVISPTTTVELTKAPSSKAKKEAPAVVSKEAVKPKGEFPWLVVGAAGAGLVAVALLWSALKSPSSAPATAGLGSYHRRGRRGRR